MLLLGCAINVLQKINTTNEVLELGDTQGRHPFAGLLSDKAEEIDDTLHVTHKVVLSELIVLRRDTGRTIIEVADTEVFTAHSNHWRCAKAKAFCTQDSGFDNVQTRFHSTVCLHANLSTQSVAPQSLVDLSETQLPGRARVPNGG